jgi:peroxiredoxin
MHTFKAVIIILSCLFSISTSALPKVGDLPRLKVQDLNGSEIDLERMRGKPLLLHFFATWCPSCERELSILEKAVHQEHGLELILLSPEPRRSKAEVKRRLKSSALRGALLEEATLSDWGQVSVLPMTFLLNQKGELVAVFDPVKNPLSEERLNQILKAVGSN